MDFKQGFNIMHAGPSEEKSEKQERSFLWKFAFFI